MFFLTVGVPFVGVVGPCTASFPYCFWPTGCFPPLSALHWDAWPQHRFKGMGHPVIVKINISLFQFNFSNVLLYVQKPKKALNISFTLAEKNSWRKCFERSVDDHFDELKRKWNANHFSHFLQPCAPEPQACSFSLVFCISSSTYPTPWLLLGSTCCTWCTSFS